MAKHEAKAAAHESAAKEYEAHAAAAKPSVKDWAKGKGKLAIAPKGKEQTIQPVPAQGGNRAAGPRGAGSDSSSRAHAATQEAYHASFGTGKSSKSADAANDDAAKAHREAASAHSAAGNEKAADHHAAMASLHEKAANSAKGNDPLVRGTNESSQNLARAAREAKGKSDAWVRDEQGRFASK